MLGRLAPHPRLSLLLLAVWLLMVNSLSVGALLLGALLALAIPLATAAFWPDTPRPMSLRKLAAYILLVLWDVVVANVVVARIILTKRNSQLSPAFVTIPLDVRSPEAITLLAGAITMTPGTVSADLSADGRSLLVHALHAPDPDAVRDEIKRRYEERLKEIFP